MRATRVIRKVRPGSIRLDRLPLDAKTLRFTFEMVYTGDRFFPPVKVARHPSGGFEIRDGRHRVTAARLAGVKLVKARFSLRRLRKEFARAAR